MNLTSFNNLIQGLQHSDPRLYEALKGLAADFIRVQLEVFPPDQVGFVDETPVEILPVLATFSYELFADNILLSWTLSTGSAARYEIREGGASFETGNILIRTDTTSARINPLLEGTHRYWIKGISENGNYSAVALFVDIIIPAVGSITITAQVVDNNVLLFWSAPTSVFRIDHYVIKKDSVEIGTANSTFASIFENIAATYIYSVQAVDVAGNIGPESSISVSVTQPPDYELREDFLSVLDGTDINGTLIEGPRLLHNTRVENWTQHFADRGWINIQDQINAGFPLYIQPSVETGSYQEVIDYGLVISNTALTISYNSVLISGLGVDIVVEIETSLDNITYTAPVVATTLFVASLRYARITFTFTALN